MLSKLREQELLHLHRPYYSAPPTIALHPQGSVRVDAALCRLEFFGSKIDKLPFLPDLCTIDALGYVSIRPTLRPYLI